CVLSRRRSSPRFSSFPYTTLFRSEEVFVNAAEQIAGLPAVAFEADVGDQVDEALHLLRRDAAAGVVARELVLQIRIVPLDGEDGDRKSTRLNSSHDQISYAVFCLK